MLLGMAQPNYGRVELLGHEIAALPPEVRGRIAYLAEGHPLYGWMTVAEAGAVLPRVSSRTLEPAVARPDPRTLRDAAHKSKLRRLSNGQRANVALALAIAPDPDLLILDDPDAGPRHGGPPRFLDVDDSSGSAAGADDSLQLAHPGRRRARRRSDRHPGRRRACGSTVPPSTSRKA